MSGIGGVPFDIIRGVPQTDKEQVDVWPVAGVAGWGAMLTGRRGDEYELIGIVYCEDNAAAEACIAACNELQGSMISLEDDFGVEFDGVLVLDVDSRDAKMPVIYQGNANCVRVSIRWRLLQAA